MARKRSSSPRLSANDASLIKKHLREGMVQHDIAAIFRVNQGRISEINTGKTFADIPPAS